MNRSDSAIRIRYAEEADRDFWLTLDAHLDPAGFARKVREKTGYVLTRDRQRLAILRFSLFWDSIPFCNMLYVKDGERRKGYGRMLTEHWEADMKARGYDLVLTSTQSDETAQFFYRAIGYRECGNLQLPFPGHEQPTELILGKALVNKRTDADGCAPF